jgi:hypothetical protein
MNEIHRVVDELRFVLQREVIEQSDELSTLVAAYSQLCHEMNLRLRRCDEYVKQGLRSEALHLAEAKPNLLDAVALLDFPERAELVEIVGMYFLTPPEPLLLEVATALNEAYAEHAPLQKLLDTHRLLALGRGPLTHRLSVLRSLADLDPASTHWEADVREMEGARFRELDAESIVAAKSGNSAALRSILSEAQGEDWYEGVPSSLLRDIKLRTSQSVRTGARHRLQELNQELYAAFSELDAARARPLRDEWKLRQQTLQAADSDPLCEQVAPVFDWLDDEDRKSANEKAYSRSTTDIERALENDEITPTELRRLKLTADRLERALPAALETRFRNRLATASVVEGRRRQLVIGGSIAAFALVAGFFGFMVHVSLEAEKTRRVAAAITALVDEGKLADARTLMQQHPAGSTSEAWLAMQAKLASAEQQERDRVAKWQAEVATVRQATDTVRAEAALKQARELSRTADEKIEVGQLQSTWQKRANEELATREQTFRERVASTATALQGLDAALASATPSESASPRKLLEVAEIQLAQLVPLRGSVAKELVTQLTLLESRLRASRQAVADLERKTELLDQLTEAALLMPGTTEAAAKAGRFEYMLREFAKALPNDARAATLKGAAEACPLSAVLARQKLIERWKRLRPADQKDAEARVREIRAFVAEYPQSPDRESLGQYQTWLNSVILRFAGDGDPDEGIRHRMAVLFSSKFIKEGHILRDRAGRTYYLQESKPKPFGSVASIKYLVGFNGETKSTSMPPEELSTPTSISPPQVDLAARVKSQIREVTIEGWRDCFLDLTGKLLNARDVDPFLRYLLVLKTLEFAGQGDLLLDRELIPVIDNLNDDDLDRSVAWMDPLSKSAEAARVRAAELLGKMPPLEPIFANATKRQDQFERDVLTLRFSVGWLEKTPRGEWICRTKWSPAGDHALHVVSRPDAAGARSWNELGHVQGKAVTIDAAAAQAAGDAALVFASSASTSVNTARTP